MEKVAWWKKLVVLIVIVVALIPAISLSEWACEKYQGWATANPDGDGARWILFKVGQIHDLMGRQDMAASAYGEYYELYKDPYGDATTEETDVALARYQQAMAWYDRDRKTAQTLTNAHKYFTYLLIKYQGTGKLSSELEIKAQDFRAQCEIDGKGSGAPGLTPAIWPPEYGPAYQP